MLNLKCASGTNSIILKDNFQNFGNYNNSLFISIPKSGYNHYM